MIKLGLTPLQRARMQQAQLETMQDTCVHLQRVTTQNEIGEETEEWVEAATYECGYSPTSSTEDRSSGEMKIRAAGLRLPLEAEGAVGAEDAIAVTHRYGEELDDPLHFEVDGAPEPGPSALVLTLRSVEL